MAWSVLAVLLAYLLGSLSGSLLLGAAVGVDIRTRGSGSAGGTNALRTLGWRFALGVVLIDVGKGALAAALPWLLPAGPVAPATLAWACALAAAAGHTWPVYYAFRGGKGAGTLAGALLVLWPAAVPVLLAVWALVLVASGFVGLATITAAIVLPIAGWLLPGATPARAVFALLAALFIVLTHRHNLQRLWRGTEYRFERARLLRRRGP